ncbi:uncharacterized protein J4E87_001276 [Alternaria ethzedia]|uniref:uncharacterized protein n=1 Tax=Alternaria ethzedia TaxID=181014 RepID=UPI0020C2B2F3|nr:uncharacterized protein J4E87_001276 [Alternaria ethzedia]KAI4634106.1 hypothetical protein J4E87_001276 [Alternaria ethzedia]
MRRQCGCDQFWDKLSAELHDESADHRPSSERSTWCVCGHHACFHLRATRAPERQALSMNLPLPPLYATGEEPRQLQASAQCDTSAAMRQLGDNLLSEGGQAIYNARIHQHSSPSQRPQRQPSETNSFGRLLQSQDTPSQISTSGLPGLPSVCLLSHERRPVANSEARYGVNQSRQTVAGLGLSMMNLESMAQLNRQQSPTSTIPDDINIAHTPRKLPNEHVISPGRANITSPSRGILEQVLEFNRNFQPDEPGDTIPNTYNPEEYVQSATEVATPSVGNTPDLSAADRAVQDGKDMIDAMKRITSEIQQQSTSSTERQTYGTVPTQLLPNNATAGPQEQLQTLLQSAPPQGLQKLVSYLAPLHNLLNSIPNVAKTMQELGSRLDLLENGSFNYVQPEDLNNTLEMYEGRLIDVEHRMDEHERMHEAMDEQSSTSSFSRRRIDNATTSFGSNHSVDSTTSSALILAAMDRKDTEMELDNIKERLDVLEAAAPPTSLQPWEVEVVLLPWGPDLKGIWFSPDEPMHDIAKTTTQNSEEWTQAHTLKTIKSLPFLGRDSDSSPYPGARNSVRGSISSQADNGWSSQDISNWASGSTDDWLFPKACGSNNLVYKRLQSRGFVRDVTFKGSSAKDIQEALSHAFSDVFDYLQYDDSDENPMISAYPGLRAPYIPLRKVLKESRLRFLTPAEMSSSALWNAQFLSAGVMMRVSGGKKRLYVTVREAYTQQVDRNEFVVMEQSWPELRQLPRYQPEQDSQMEGNDEQCQAHVPEADAKEACWQFVETYDAPPASVHSSFGSNQSVQLSMRPAGRNWRRSITPNSILKNKQPQPISPLSENHPQRPLYYRNRTVSASVVDTVTPRQSKRRFNPSIVEQSSAPQVTSRAPSLPSARLKRRRVTNSSSPRPEEAHVTIWNATPRQSREPPSPFYSSQPALPRSNSDVMSRPSQRSVAIAGKSTPFAYATPHSGPFPAGPGFNAYNNGGDTEPDDDNDAYDNDDGEKSWRGVTDDDNDQDNDSASSSVLNAETGAQEGASFSGDDSGFGSDNGEDSDAPSEDDGEVYAQRQHGEEDEDEDDEDVFDSLLSIIEA